MKVKLITLTPELAQKYLASSSGNRPIKPALVKRYSEDVKADRWRVTHEGLAFDIDGVMYDGHHRCHAVILAGKSIETYAFYDMSRSAKKSTNIGRSRTIADVFSSYSDGMNLPEMSISQSKRMAAIATTAWIYAGKQGSPTPERAAEFLKNVDTERYLEVATQCSQLPVCPGALIWPLAVLNSRSPHLYRKLHKSLSTGAGMLPGDPALVLRDYLMQNRRGTTRTSEDKTIQRRKTVKALVSFQSDKKLRYLHSSNALEESSFLGPKTHVKAAFGID